MNTISNQITLVGNMGLKPTIIQNKNGSKVARFSMATDHNYKTKEGDLKKNTEWHRVFAWGNLAQFIEEYGRKGKSLVVHGRVVKRSYLDKRGLKQNITEVEAQYVFGI